MPINGESMVKFKLWPVLAFLVLLSAIGMGYLFTVQGGSRDESRAARQILSERITTMEANYRYIVEGIGELKRNQKDMMVILSKQRKSKGEE